METLEARIAKSALHTFDELPKKSKPRIHPDGTREWVPMSAIVLVCDAGSADEQLTCVTLATGCKCLPVSSLPKCYGKVLHDSHAEVLALRGLNFFLLSEVSKILSSEGKLKSKWLCDHSSLTKAEEVYGDDFRVNGAQRTPFAIRPDVSIHMFSTEAPCGDASMEILMSELGPDDSVPWEALRTQRPPNPETSSSAQFLQGRGFFSHLGELRRKPSRPDAEPALSKSCTDKLSAKQVTSILSFPTYHFVALTPNAYLASLILPTEKYSDTGCKRAFSQSGRLSALQRHKLPDNYYLRAFQVRPLPPDFQPRFPFNKSFLNPSSDIAQPPVQTGDRPKKPKPKPSNLSALYIHPPTSFSCPHPGVPTLAPRPDSSPQTTETLLSGLPQGHSLHTLQTKPLLNPSKISRHNLFQLGKETALLFLLHHQSSLSEPSPLTSIADQEQPQFVRQATISHPLALLEAETYEDAKTIGGIRGMGCARRRIKDLLANILATPQSFPPSSRKLLEQEDDGIQPENETSVLLWPRNLGDETWSLVSGPIKYHPSH